MTQHELKGDGLLAALGALQRSEREALAQLEEPARVLAAQAPEDAQAAEVRLMRELFDVPAAAAVSEPTPVSAHASAAAAVPARAPVPVLADARARRGKQWLSAAAVSCAMAAAVALWLGRAPSGPGQPFEVTYTLVPPAPDAHTRSAAEPQAAPAVYSLGRTLTFAFRPSARYSGALQLSAYATQGGEVIRLAPVVQLDPAGGARVLLPTADSTLSEGSWELLFYLAAEHAAAPSDSQLQRRTCPADTRCLTFSARFVKPKDL